MIPFKFRVWCFENNKWVEDNCSLNHKGELFLHTAFESHNITNDKRFELSYSTGLFDKYEKLIFSGDILTYYNHGQTIIHLIYYEEINAKFMQRELLRISPEKKYELLSFSDLRRTKSKSITQNIFENPELLENSK